MGWGDFFGKAAKAARKAEGAAVWEDVKGMFDMGEQAASAREVSKFFQPLRVGIRKAIKNNIDPDDLEGAGKYIRMASNKIHGSAALTGGVYGGVGGGVMGLTSSDRDMGFWKGATMGAISGVRSMRGGISAGAATGATIGAVMGGFTDGSIIGGAFYGAMAGGMGKKYVVGGWRAGQKHGGAKGIGAMATAIKKDIGSAWKGQRSRKNKGTGSINSNKGL